MNLLIKMNLDNAAFQDGNRGYEIVNVLLRIQDRVERGDTEGSVLDTNGGGRVATFKVGKGKFKIPQ